MRVEQEQEPVLVPMPVPVQGPERGPTHVLVRRTRNPPRTNDPLRH